MGTLHTLPRRNREFEALVREMAQFDAEAHRAVFAPSPLDQLGTVIKPTINPVTGKWEYIRFRRFNDAKGARADRQASTVATKPEEQ